MIPRRSLLALLTLGALAACDQPGVTTASATATTGSVTAANLAGTSWRVLSIAGVRVEDMSATRMAFDGATINGSFGCNSFSGPYSAEGGLLRVGAAATTRMACPGTAGQQERSGLRQLAFPMQVVPNGPNQLILSGREGQSFILER